MSMVIAHNLSALNTYNQLTKNSTSMSKSLEKLSSGYRINSAADDAAGLAISEKMRGQISGLNQASSNSQNGISMVQTAEGALEETTSILQRMRELSVQSASDTNTDSDRSNIQDEVNALTSEIDNIANTTQFNTKNLLDGSMGSAQTTAVANIESNSALTSSTAKAAVATGTTLVGLYDSSGNSLGITATDTVKVSYVKDGKTYSNSYTAAALTVASLSTTDGTVANGDFTMGIDATTKDLTSTAVTAGFSSAIYGMTVTVTDSTGTENTAATEALSNFTQTTKAQDQRNDGSATLQIGANTGQSIQVNIDNMSAGALGVENLDVSTQASAEVAIKTIDTATAMVSAQRAKLGAVDNRLQSTINNLTTSSENLTAAESSIRDVDMASEMAKYTQLSVTTQAATAMLAQANQQPQQVLTLLK